MKSDELLLTQLQDALETLININNSINNSPSAPLIEDTYKAIGNLINKKIPPIEIDSTEF